MMEWQMYNPNPQNRRVGDCTIRAIAKVLSQDWQKTYIDLCLQGFMMCDMPSANSVWGAYLRSKGYRRGVLSSACSDCYSVRDFCRDNPYGSYVLALPSHVVAITDGDYFDTWDSGSETPLYYWYKEE